MTFLCLYISRWLRQTWDTAPYFTVVNQSEARISTEHGIKWDTYKTAQNHAIICVSYVHTRTIGMVNGQRWSKWYVFKCILFSFTSVPMLFKLLPSSYTSIGYRLQQSFINRSIVIGRVEIFSANKLMKYACIINAVLGVIFEQYLRWLQYKWTNYAKYCDSCTFDNQRPMLQTLFNLNPSMEK